MTIYLEIIKGFLVEKITEIRNNAISADNSYLNYAASWIGLGRDAKVSTSKQKLADELLYALRDFPECDDDYQTSLALINLIEKYKVAAAEKSGSAGYDEGAFGPGMKKAKELIEDLYKHLQSLNLHNIPHNDDPLNIYRFHMARYFSNKLLKAAHDPTFLERILTNPKLTSSYLVTHKKRELILENLKNCEKKLLGGLPLNANYLSDRRDWVLVFIEKLSRGNQGVCNDHTITSTASLSLSFFSTVSVSTPVLGPGVGFLHDCLMAAFKDVSTVSLEKMAAAVKAPASLRIKNAASVSVVSIIEEDSEEYTEVNLNDDNLNDNTPSSMTI